MMTMEELKLNDLNTISNSIANDEEISNVRDKIREAFDMGWTRCEDAVMNNFGNGNYSSFNLNYLLNNMLKEVKGLTSANYMHHKASLEAYINNIKNLLGLNDNVENSSNTAALSKNNVANVGIEEIKSKDIFVKGEEYVINQAENEEAKFFLLGKKLHVYSAKCSCPGNKIKIDAVGTFTQCSTRSDGEYLYTFSPEDGGENVVLTTRSHFIRFVII